MTRMCDVCGVRPAVGTIERIRPGQPPETLHLCQVHLAERRGMGSSFGGLGMFDDLFSRFFSDAAGGEARPGVEAVAHLADAGFDPEFGARPLQRTIQRLVENHLSRMLLQGSLREGDAVTVRLLDGRLDFDVLRKVGEPEDVGETAASAPA
jgi:C-terminal, D2-small domain, of ClpB protein